jgi:hypothetical protein
MLLIIVGIVVMVMTRTVTIMVVMPAAVTTMSVTIVVGIITASGIFKLSIGKLDERVGGALAHVRLTAP